MRFPRRTALLLPAIAGVPGCAVDNYGWESENAALSPFAPWHMWGNSQVVAPVVTGVTGVVPFVASQLLKASYGRPESWKFLFSATLLNLPDNSGGTVFVDVSFDLTVGIGRSSLSIPGFLFFGFTYTNVAAATGRQKWATRALQSLLDDSTPASDSNPRQYIDSFVGQDIQLVGNARAATSSGPAIGLPVGVRLDAFISPVNHIRPEWFRDAEGDGQRFRGQEQDGT